MAADVQMMQSSASSTHQQAPTSTAPVLEFVCLFTRDLRRKQKRWQDGRLKFHTYNKRIMVYDDRGNFVGDAHWHEDHDFDEGEEVELERGGVIVQVAECTGSRDQDLSELVDKRARERAERQSAAIARRPPAIEDGTPPHAVVPHFQMRHKPLHHLVGTPTGHHGRALMPTESPYEERQKLAVSPPKENARPTKRRKREASPLSKSGYAQSLFGAVLTLSGVPTSSPLTRHRPPRTAPIPIDSESIPSSDPSQHDESLDSIPKLVSASALNGRKAAQISRPSTALLKRVSRASTTSAQGRAESQSLPHPIRCETSLSDRRDSTAGARQTALKRKRETVAHVVDSDSQEPIPVNLCSSDQEVDQLSPLLHVKRKSLHDMSSAAALKSKINKSPTASGATAVRGEGLPAELISKNKAAVRADNEGRQKAFQEQAINEPRTELRIKPRKKRGLMISENLDTHNSSASRLPKGRISRQNSSTSFRDTSIGDANYNALEDEESVDNHGNNMLTKSKSSNKQDKETRGLQRGAPNAGGSEDVPTISGHLTNVEPSEEAEPCTRHSKTDKGRTMAFDSAHENTILGETSGSTRNRNQPSRKNIKMPAEKFDKEQDLSDESEFTFPDSIPPRLAQLGRKSIRSKEIIGFIFEETDCSSAPQQNDDGSESGRESLTRDFSADHSSVHPARPETNRIDQVTIIDRPQDRPPIKETRAVDDGTILEPPKGVGTATPYIETIPRLPQKQTSKLVRANTEPGVQRQVLEDTTVTQQPPAKFVVNPATRGKKAAKPSDAVGQVPQCPLLSEAGVTQHLNSRTHENGIQKSKIETRAREASIAPMPGFTRANGGPWSREAHDLFEFTRPP